MDLRKLSNENKLDLCKKYYIGGFALLPFLWFVNSIWFFKEAFLKEEFTEQKQIRSLLFKIVLLWGKHIGSIMSMLDVIRSMIGTLVWTAIIAGWIVIFQLNRVSWGETADAISFIIPRGMA